MSLLTVAASAGAVWSIQHFAVKFLPLIFGLNPAASAWIALSALIVGAFFIKDRLAFARRDSPRLTRVNMTLDILTGAIVGAVIVALPGILGGTAWTAFSHLSLATKVAPLFVAGAYIFGKNGYLDRGAGKLLGLGAVYGAFRAGSLVFAHPLIPLASILGGMALAASVAVLFVTGSIIDHLREGKRMESYGRFSFPSYPFVLMMVWFAKLLGYNAPTKWINGVTAAWQIPGISRYFTAAWLGFVGWAVWAVWTSHAAVIPVFFALIFAAERALDLGMKKLVPWLTQNYRNKAGQAIPDTAIEPLTSNPTPAASWSAKHPKLGVWIHTITLLAGLWGFGFSVAWMLSVPLHAAGVFLAFSKQLMIGGAIAAVQIIFSPWIIQKLFKAEKLDQNNPAKYPDAARVHAVFKKLLGPDYNESMFYFIPRAAMAGPNAFATGPSRKRAMIGITEDFLRMTRAENLREELVNVMGYLQKMAADAPTEQRKKQVQTVFESFLGSLREPDVFPEIPADATPETVVKFLNSKTEEQLRRPLTNAGNNMLAGVGGHEWSHIVNHDVALNGAAGVMNSAINSVVRGYIWGLAAVGATFKAATLVIRNRLRRAWEVRVRKNLAPPAKLQFVPTLSSGLFAMLAAIFVTWSGVPGNLFQLAVSREREHRADMGGATRTKKPAWLGLALACLITYKLPPGKKVDTKQLLMLAGVAHMTTINPFEWLELNDLLPETHSTPDGSKGSEDSSIPSSNDNENRWPRLFMDHPDTFQRMLDMSEEAQRQGEFDPSSSAGGGSAGRKIGTGKLGKTTLSSIPKSVITALSKLSTTSIPPRFSGVRPQAVGLPKTADIALLVHRSQGVSTYSGIMNGPEARALRTLRHRGVGYATIPLDSSSPAGVPPQETGPPKPEVNTAASGGFFRRAFSVLPDKSRNRAYLLQLFGGMLVSLGSALSQNAMMELAKTPSRVSYSFGANYGAQAISGLTSGKIVDYAPSVNRLLVKTYLLRLALPALILFLLFTHQYSWMFGGFLLFLFARGYLMSIGSTAGAVLYNRTLDGYDAFYNRANTVRSVVMDLWGIPVPILASAIIMYLGKSFTLAMAGGVLAYVVEATLVLIVALTYRRFLKVPEDEFMGRRQRLETALKGPSLWQKIIGIFKSRTPSSGPQVSPELRSRIKRVSVKEEEGRGRFFIVEMQGNLSDVSRDPGIGVPQEFEGTTVELGAPQSELMAIREGRRLTERDPYLNAMLVTSTAELFVGSGFFVILSKYISSVLGITSPVIPGWLAHLPVLGGLLHFLTSHSGIFGWYFAAAALGGAIAKVIFPMILWRDRATEDLLPRLMKFQGELKRVHPLPNDESYGKAVHAVRDAVYGTDGILAQYGSEWKKNHDASWTLEEFQEGVFNRIESNINAGLFGGSERPEEVNRVIVETGLQASVTQWSKTYFDRLIKEARQEAKTGMDAAQRQWRLGTILFIVGALAYWLVFPHNLWASLGAVILATFLQSPSSMAWLKVSTTVLLSRYRDSLGRISAFGDLYELVWAISGIFVFGALATLLPISKVLLIFGGGMTLVAALRAYVVLRARRIMAPPTHG